MGNLVTLTCPRCGRRAFYDGDRDRDDLKEAARDHLAEHRVSEPKQGIFGVMMVEEADRVDEGRADRVPDERGLWVERPRLVS